LGLGGLGGGLEGLGEGLGSGGVTRFRFWFGQVDGAKHTRGPRLSKA
jgi:hypothetical protein